MIKASNKIIEIAYGKKPKKEFKILIWLKLKIRKKERYDEGFKKLLNKIENYKRRY